ncbi:MAG TPA: HAMP domain-containing sensor histidine kinase, partial [Candidatus Binataceae bacterium]|nr:HAMP domain-containing sensor histidine kinase [Candidatus Binataceae bacterium]
ERESAKLKGQTPPPSAAAAPQAAPTPSEDPRFKSDEERRAYEQALKQASREAGFYIHLMWYGIVIGFLFLLNNIATPFGYQWWIWPAFGWGFGIVSHAAAVYGWDVIRQRVFEPAIQREVHAEVTKEKQVMATEKQASLDELTASFAHEIRNPIAAAKSLVQQMGEDPTSNENVEYAKVALDELQRVEKSVSHLLKYAKEEDYSFDNVNLASIIDASLTQMRAKLEAKNVSISRNYIGGPTVRADSDKLRQVFTNIIDNALDAMDSNPAERHLDLAIRSNIPGMATVTIRDNGCGIPEDKLAKIFNPFYTTKQTGTGLGMGIAKKVVESHRGRIDVSSRVGEGTLFSISIPLADAARAYLNGDLNGAAPSANQNGTAPQAAAAQPATTPINNDPSSTTILDPSPTVQLNAGANAMRGRQ